MRPATGDPRGAHVPRVDLHGPNRGQRRRTGTGRRNVGPAAETSDGDLTGRHRLRAEPVPTAPPAVRSPRHTRRGPSLSGLPGHVVTSAVMLSAGTIVTGSVLLTVEGSDWTAPVDGPPRTAPTTEALADRPGTSTTDPAPRLDIGLGFVPEPAADWLGQPGSVFAMPGQVPASAEIDDRAGIDQLVGLIDVPIPDATAPIGSEPSPLPAVLDGGGGDRLQVPPPIAAEIVGPVPSSAAPLLPSPASRIQEDKRSTDRIKSLVPATDGVGELQVADADIVPPPVVAALRAVDPGPLVVDGSTAGTDKAPATSLASRSLELQRDTIAAPVAVAPVAVAPVAVAPVAVAPVAVAPVAVAPVAVARDARSPQERAPDLPPSIPPVGSREDQENPKLTEGSAGLVPEIDEATTADEAGSGDEDASPSGNTGSRLLATGP